MILATRADDEFANAASGVGGAVGRLRGEALVVVVMTVDNHVGVGVIEGLPERLHRQVIAVSAAGTEKGLVPVGKRACRWMCG